MELRPRCSQRPTRQGGVRITATGVHARVPMGQVNCRGPLPVQKYSMCKPSLHFLSLKTSIEFVRGVTFFGRGVDPSPSRINVNARKKHRTLFSAASLAANKATGEHRHSTHGRTRQAGQRRYGRDDHNRVNVYQLPQESDTLICWYCCLALAGWCRQYVA